MGYFLVIVSIVLIVGYIFVFIDHVDFFATKKEAVGRVIEQSESRYGDEIHISLQYYNDYKKDPDTAKKFCRYSTVENLFKNNVQGYTCVLYSKWRKQTFLKGYSEPTWTIFILDFIDFVLLGLCMKAGISRIHLKLSSIGFLF